MRPTRIPASEWRKLTDDERRRRIQDNAVTDLDALDPNLRAIIDDMVQQAAADTPAA